MNEIEFHPDASEEYQSAREWYRARSPTAATRFEAELDRILSLVESNTDLFPAYDATHRFAVLRYFPFSVVYRTMAGRIIVVALAHSRRSAGYWLGRA